MSTEPHAHDEGVPRTSGEDETPSLAARLGADWIAVIVAAVLVLLAGFGLLPTIPFLIK